MSRLSQIAIHTKDIIDIYHHALMAIKPDTLVKNALTIKDNTLILKDPISRKENIEIVLAQHNVHVIGGGKSVLAMTKGLAEIANRTESSHIFSAGLLSVPIGLKSEFDNSPLEHNLLNSIGVELQFGAYNNLPDNNSIAASRSMLKRIRSACAEDLKSQRKPLFIVIISGGGSACLASPKYISLAEKLDMINFLVQKGADIIELNKVRRFFSQTKGGQLASHILQAHPESKVISLILSDIVGDPIEHIASGPTYIDPVTVHSSSDHCKHMIDILEKYNFPGVASIREKTGIVKNSTMSDLSERMVINHLIGNNTVALRAAIDRAEKLCYRVEYLGNELTGYSTHIVDNLCHTAKEVLKNPSESVLVIGGGEATVEKRSGDTWGLGGRSQEMALDYMISKMKNDNNEQVQDEIDIFLACSTDGQDGPTDVAACLASKAEWCLDEPFSYEEAMKAKQCHDSYNFWNQHKPNWLIKTGLTGTNVMDIYMNLVSNKCFTTSQQTSHNSTE